MPTHTPCIDTKEALLEVGGSVDGALLQKTRTFGISWIQTQRGMEWTECAQLLPALLCSGPSAGDGKVLSGSPIIPSKKDLKALMLGFVQGGHTV